MKTKKQIILSILLLMLTTGNAFATARLYPEKTYQNTWCQANKGQSEYVLFDQTRVDCLLPDYAIEFDFANKWSEAVGQSLYYSLITQKKAGVVLIMENGQKDQKYLKRLLKVSTKHDIKVWTISPSYIDNRYN